MNRTMFKRAIGWLAFCAASLMPILARGQGAPPTGLRVELDYASTPPGCPDQQAFAAIVAERLEYDPFQPPFAWRVRVTIDPTPDSLEGRFVWRNAEGQWVGDRVFPSHSLDCESLARAMAFALALQIRFYSLADAPPVDRVPEPPPPPVKPPATVDQVLPPPAPPAGPTLALGLGASGALGLASRPSPLGRLFGRVAWRRISAEVALELGWPSLTRRAAASSPPSKAA
jgi:hypothetical protein